MAEFVIFFIMAAVALGAAIGMVLARNPVHSALLLVTVLVAIAVMFLLQDAQLARRGADHRLRRRDRRPVPLRDHAARRRPQRVAATTRSGASGPRRSRSGVIGLAEVLFLAGRHWATGRRRAARACTPGAGGNVERVARSLFTDFLWPFEVTAILLVVAVVGGVVLARRSGLPPGAGVRARARRRRHDAERPRPEDSPTR